MNIGHVTGIYSFQGQQVNVNLVNTGAESTNAAHGILGDTNATYTVLGIDPIGVTLATQNAKKVAFLPWDLGFYLTLAAEMSGQFSGLRATG